MCLREIVTQDAQVLTFQISLPGGMAYALRSERSVLATSRFESGGRDQLVNRAMGEARFQVRAVFE